MSSSGLQHLLDIKSLSDTHLRSLLGLSLDISRDPEAFYGGLSGSVLINLFMEPSTRTRMSIEMAAKRLGMHVINFQPETSSVVKGEALIDTFHTLQAMSPDVIAIRHQQGGTAASLASEAQAGVHIINAGDGCDQHPTQALLDVVTLLEQQVDLEQAIITIAGDIKHSRVAGSNMELFKKLGVAEIRLAAPHDLQPELIPDGVKVFDNLDEALNGANVVMMLRVQRERFASSGIFDEAGYFENWGLNNHRLSLAADDCMVIHPGPVNRGVEISTQVADGGQSLIRRQVRNGVFTRMAVLLTLLQK